MNKRMKKKIEKRFMDATHLLKEWRYWDGEVYYTYEIKRKKELSGKFMRRFYNSVVIGGRFPRFYYNTEVALWCNKYEGTAKFNADRKYWLFAECDTYDDCAAIEIVRAE